MSKEKTNLLRAKEVLVLAKEYINQSHNETSWEIVSTTARGTITKRRNFPKISPMSCHIIDGIVNKPAQDLLRKIWDVDEKAVKSGDPDIMMWREVESGDNWKICHQTVSVNWPLYPREICFFQGKFVEKETVWLVAFTVDHPQVPRRDNEYVRAIINMAIWKFAPMGKNQTSVTRIVHIDPAGNIPAFLVNSSVKKHIKIVEDL